MRKEIRALFAALVFAASLAPAPYALGAQPKDAGRQRSEAVNPDTLAKEVRHELVMLPYYSAFDNLAFRVDGDTVTLEGQVVRPVLKSDAQAAVKNIGGVTTIVNNIEVLPLSFMDDQLRRAVYRTIYRDSSLFRYGFQPVAAIHIIVKNGNVTLEGVVDNTSDKNLANIRASQVANVFSVKNDLVVANNGK